MDEYVSGLKIAVDNSLAVDVCQALQDLSKASPILIGINTSRLANNRVSERLGAELSLNVKVKYRSPVHTNIKPLNQRVVDPLPYAIGGDASLESVRVASLVISNWIALASPRPAAGLYRESE